MQQAERLKVNANLFEQKVFRTPRSPGQYCRHCRELKMVRFSKPFWFTLFAGGFSSLLLTCALLWFLTTQSGAMVALCRQGKAGCASWESLQHLFRVASIAQVCGTFLLFGLALNIGRRFVQPAPPAVTDVHP
jgi:hypothetical protein